MKHETNSAGWEYLNINGSKYYKERKVENRQAHARGGGAIVDLTFHLNHDVVFESITAHGGGATVNINIIKEKG